MFLSNIRIGSLFSGVCGLEQSFLKDPKFKLEFVADPDKYCSAVLSYLHPRTPNLGSVADIVRENKPVPDVDLIIAGTSCQNFSYQGDQLGLEGLKSKLFYEFAKIVKSKQPKYVIWENVVGASTHKDFKIVKDIFQEIGYEIDYEVFDASRFSGTIQQRRRIILLATRKDFSQVRLDRSIPNISLSPEMQNLKERLVGFSKSHRSGEEEQDERIDARINYGIANTLVTGWGCSGVSTKNYINENGILRELNINECELLMTWEKDHTKYGFVNGDIFEIPMAQRFKMCGNGVVSEMIENLFRNIEL
jgi:site-specific DNA-cytosine methylase